MGKLIYTRDDKRLPAMLKQTQRSIRDAQRPTGTERDQTMLQMREQVAELLARRSFTRRPADLSISVSNPGSYPTATRAVQFPAPEGGGRIATVHLSAEFVRTSSSGNINVFIEVLSAGSVVWKRQAAAYVGDTASAPPGWGNPGMNDMFQIPVPTESAAELTIRIYGNTFVSGTVSARMQNIAMTLMYGDRLD